jgi:hypothetical protein
VADEKNAKDEKEYTGTIPRGSPSPGAGAKAAKRPGVSANFKISNPNKVGTGGHCSPRHPTQSVP